VCRWGAPQLFLKLVDACEQLDRQHRSGVVEPEVAAQTPRAGKFVRRVGCEQGRRRRAAARLYQSERYERAYDLRVQPGLASHPVKPEQRTGTPHDGDAGVSPRHRGHQLDLLGSNLDSFASSSNSFRSCLLKRLGTWIWIVT
jgi:hypothetical protein